MVKSNKAATVLLPQTRVRKAARIVLAERLQETWSCLDRARDGEPESGIHAMRVAAKRLREALRLFRDAYDAAPYAAGLALVDELNDHLGRVRDSDVLALTLGGYSTNGTAAFVGGLIGQVTAARDVDQHSLIGELDRLGGLQFDTALLEVIWNGRHERDHQVAGLPIRDFARQAVRDRAKRVRKRLRAVHGADDAEGLHRVRVANKTLRYAVEPFLGIFGRPLKFVYRSVSDLHNALGDLHDLDVLADRVGRFGEQSAEREPVDEVLAEVSRRRAAVAAKVAALIDGEAGGRYVRAVLDAVD